MNFDDQVVLITGASRGIGRSVAQAFSKAGAMGGVAAEQGVRESEKMASMTATTESVETASAAQAASVDEELIYANSPRGFALFCEGMAIGGVEDWRGGGESLIEGFERDAVAVDDAARDPARGDPGTFDGRGSVATLRPGLRGASTRADPREHL